MRRLRPSAQSRAFTIVVALLILAAAVLPLSAQTAGITPRCALVIGNNEYEGLTSLANPVNDARDMAAALKRLGFTVDLRLNADLTQMEEGAALLSRRLSEDRNALGLFYYAGHGVQSDGINYLVPSRTDIEAEAILKTKAFSIQRLLDLMKDAGNSVNLVFLDACRDNPYSWRRSGVRGLSVVGSQPPDSIIVYATRAGCVVEEGTGRNGVFTGELLKYIETPGLDLDTVLNRTAQRVLKATGNAQNPEVYNRFFGDVYLAGLADSASDPAQSLGFGVEKATTGSLTVQLASPGTVSAAGVSSQVSEGTVSMIDLPAGEQAVMVSYADGKTESRSVTVPAGGSVIVSFTYVPSPRSTQRTKDHDGFVRLPGGTFTMGSPSSEAGRQCDEPQRQVTVGGFYIGKYEVTQAEWIAIMGSNPSDFKGDQNPVEQVSWYDALVYCNKRSLKEGRTPCYSIKGTTDPAQWGSAPTSRDAAWDAVICDWIADGYRLPTEAEWEYACRAGTTTPFNTGKSITTSQANYNGDYPYDGGAKGEDRKKTLPVGSFPANAFGLYDNHGNVWEWCWDWYGDYGGGSPRDPRGAPPSGIRVERGGSWAYRGENIRSAERSSDEPWYRDHNLGFRLVSCP